MDTIWILVADSAFARILECESIQAKPIEREVLMNPTARQKQQDLVSSKPGRGSLSGGEGRHQYGGDEETRQHEVDQFAQSVVARLSQAQQAKAFTQLVLIAAPKFLGQLRQHLTPQLSACIHRDLNKDLVRMDVNDIMAHLR